MTLDEIAQQLQYIREAIQRIESAIEEHVYQQDIEEALDMAQRQIESLKEQNALYYIHPMWRDHIFALDVLKKFGHEELPNRL